MAWREADPTQADSRTKIVGAVFLDVGFKHGQVVLVIFGRSIENVLHIAVIQFENTEAASAVYRFVL